MKKQMSLYYTNRGYVTIIKWTYFLCNPRKTAVATSTVFQMINWNSVSVHARKKGSPLYYANIPPISIIKWHLFFHKVLHKKVLFHTQQYQIPSYVIIREMWDTKIHTKWHLLTISNGPHVPFSHFINFAVIDL